MAPLANDMTLLLNKIERRLGLTILLPNLPEYLNKEHWCDVIKEDTLVTFSRYFPNKLKMVINDETCYKKKDEQGVTWYYIRDEVLQGNKLLGVMDIDWTDNSNNNSSLGTASVGTYWYPASTCPAATFESIVGLQMAADFASLYNRGILIDYDDNGRFALKGLGNVSYDLNSFTVILLIEHTNLSTISPTKMEIFESLAMSDIANFLYQGLKFYDGLETAFVNIDLKLSELNQVADKRDNIIEEIRNAWVTPSNDNIPYIWSV